MRRLWATAAVGLALVACAHAGAGGPGGAAKSVQRSLAQHRPFTAVVAPAGAVAGEAAEDEAEYFRRFVERAHGRIDVHRLSPAAAAAAWPGWPLALQRATVFVDAGGRALLYRGRIVEPEVYEQGRHFAETGTATDEAAAWGLAPFDLR
jgi:hypothetical protein